MYLLYSFLLFVALCLAAPYLLFQALLHRKYLGSLRERLGLGLVARNDEPRLLVHCVSVGEFLAAEPLLEALRKALPHLRLVISTTTATGQALARERVSSYAEVCYFPLDFRSSVDRFLSAVKPSVVLILETEIWPNFLKAAQERSIPVVIANGRISDRSFARYRLFKPFLKRVLRCIDLALMQSRQDGDRLLALGAVSHSVGVCGNIKYDLGTEQQALRLQSKAEELNALLGLEGSMLIVAGSTVAGEEELLLQAYRQVRSLGARMLIAPRHPERFEQVAQLIESKGWKVVRRSQVPSPVTSSELILLDSIGELAAVYRFATLVFVGGSLVPHGGHNILEPALYGKAILTGPHTSNFRRIVEDFTSHGALIQLKSSEQLMDEMRRLLSDPVAREQLGRQALRVMEANRGAVDRHMQYIRGVIERVK